MALPVRQLPTMQVFKTGDVFAVIEPTADISAAAAKEAFILMPKLRGGLDWPMLQVGYDFTAGATKTANIVIHAREIHTQRWRALAVIEAEDAAAVTPNAGQVEQFEMAPGCDVIAVQVTLGAADARPHITIKPLAIVHLPIEVL